MSLLLNALTDQIATGLLRKTAVTCSRWAELYRVIDGQPLNYRNHPWTRALRDCTRPWAGPKAAQMGFTEAALDIAFFNIDRGRSVLYLLPKRNPDATDFSKSRFDPAIESSPYLSTLFTDVNNIGHKRAGSASLYIRGSRSKSAVKSIPTPNVIFDEYDEMLMANVQQAHERMSGHESKQWIKFSTPTAPEWGIDEVFNTTNQQHYIFKCPRCGKYTHLDFPDSLVLYTDSILDLKNLRRSHYQCPLCRGALYHENKHEWLSTSEWVPMANFDSEVDGFYINQYYSFTITPREIAEVAIQAQTNPSKEQEYWNSKGGKAHIPQGAGLHDEHFPPLYGSYSRNDPIRQGWITMGVDQGKKIYYNIDLWQLPDKAGRDINAQAHCINLTHGIVYRFEDLDRLMREYQVLMCVIDAHPERREADKFMRRFYGFVKLCFYPRGINGKSLSRDENEQTISVDRTSWIDQALERFRARTITLPRDPHPSYVKHMKALIRRYEEDKNGNPIARYINRGPDHFAHARTYSEIALPLAISFKTNQNVENFL
jgi:hypothetical protein